MDCIYITNFNNLFETVLRAVMHPYICRDSCIMYDFFIHLLCTSINYVITFKYCYITILTHVMQSSSACSCNFTLNTCMKFSEV